MIGKHIDGCSIFLKKATSTRLLDALGHKLSGLLPSVYHLSANLGISVLSLHMSGTVFHP